MPKQKKLSDHTMRAIIRAQKQEQTEYIIYQHLSRHAKKDDNKKLLSDIAAEEKKHYNFWKKYTNKAQKEKKGMVWFYTTLSKLLGVTFAVKLMEKVERNAQELYREIKSEVPEANKIIQDEEKHEDTLIQMINEERLSYVGSIVLGLNDALVELTGALAGLTLALQNAELVAVAGLITGIAASFSMAASEYLSVKSDQDQHDKNPLKAATYTGIAYLITVVILIAPYFIFGNLYVSLAISLTSAILIILFFTFYTAIAQDKPFTKRFLEMAGLSLGVAALTFGIGFVVRHVLNIEI